MVFLISLWVALLKTSLPGRGKKKFSEKSDINMAENGGLSMQVTVTSKS